MIQIKSEMLVPAKGKPVSELRSQVYLAHNGLARREIRQLQSQSDTSDYSEFRDSIDNGRTWGQWIREKPVTKERIGEQDEMEWQPYLSALNIWNPVHKHYVSLTRQFIYINGYSEAVANHWNNKPGRYIHSFLEVADEEKNQLCSQLVAYEDGIPYRRETYREDAYLTKNYGIGTHLIVLKNGDILFHINIIMSKCCSMAGCDVNEVFPSCANHGTGIQFFLGKWNKESKRYDLTKTALMMLDDRVSSRGLTEPIYAELNSGKILMLARGSNTRVERWNSRISPYAPGYKFYCLSDDGGKTFSPLMPWHFDSREVVYSSATFSQFIRSRKNGKLYWFGNMTDPTKADGNYPRYPLQMVEIDEEWGVAKKDTLTVIDTRREGETQQVQLSNFCLLEDRETGDIELYLSKLGQYEGRHVFDCETWKYTITL